MKKSVKTNYLFNVSYQVFALIVPLLVTPYVSRILGADNIGQYSYSYAIVSYFVLIAGLGTATYGIRNISASKDIEERSKNFFEILFSRLTFGGVSIIVYLIYSLFLSGSTLLAIIQGLYLVAVLFDISWFYQGIEGFKKLTIRNFICKILTVIFIFVFVKYTNDLWKYIIILSGFTVIGNISMFFGLRKNLCKVSFSSLKPLSHFKEYVVLFIPTIAVQVYSLIDKTLIGLMINETILEEITEIIDGVEVITTNIVQVSNLENAYYEQSEKIIKMSLMIITSINSVLIPKISIAYKNNDKEKIKYYIRKSFSFVWLLSIPMCLGICVISKSFVPVFFGEGYDKVATILPIMSLLFPLMGINSICGLQYLVSIGKQKKYTIILLIGGSLNFILDLILIPYFYSIGAAIASVIGELLMAVISLYILRKDDIIRINKIIISALKYIIAGAMMFLIVYIINNNQVTSTKLLFFSIAIGVITYAIALIILRDKFFNNIALDYISKAVTSDHRIKWIDWAKCIDIFLVVLGHAFLTYFPEKTYLTSIIYIFHMPLFFYLSGITLKTDGGIKKFTIKKLKSILLPYLFFIVLTSAAQLAFAIYKSDYSFFTSLNDTYTLYSTISLGSSSIYSNFWFLPCIFVSYIISYFIVKYVKKDWLKLLISVILAASAIVYGKFIHVSLPFCLEDALLAQFFMLLGYFAKYDNITKILKSKLSLAISICVSFLISFIVINLNYSHFEFYNLQFDSILCFIFGSISFIYMISSILINLEKFNFELKYMSIVGQWSLYIYGLHFIVQAAIGFAIPAISNDFVGYLIVIMAALLNIIVVCFITYCYKIAKKKIKMRRLQ